MRRREQRFNRRQFVELGAGAVGAAGLGPLLAACGGDAASVETTGTTQASEAEPMRGGTAKLVMNAFTPADSLDPAKNFYLSGLLFNGLFYDSLVTTDAEWNLGSGLAEDWDVGDDLTTYTLRLRQGVEFHSGKTVAAEDVVDSFQRILDPEVGSIGYVIYNTVLKPEKVTAVDPTTVRFELERPDAFFLDKLASIYGRVHEAGADFATSAGTGPFKSVRFEGGTGFEAVRNDNYWQDGLPYLDGVEFVAIADPATTTESVISGDADVSDLPSFASVPKFENSEGLEVLKDPYGFAYDIEIDGSKEPFSDASVRQALKMLVDREKLVRIALSGQGTPSADSYVNPKDPFYPDDLEPVPYDPERARSLLAEAGLDQSWKPEISTGTLGGTNDLAVLLRDAWKEGGIDASVKVLSSSDFDKVFYEAPIALTFWTRLHPSFALPYYYASDGIFNLARIKDPEIDRMLVEVQGIADVDRQKEVFGDILHRYNDEAATIWPYHSFAYWPHKKRLQGIATNPTEIVDFRRAHMTG